MLQPIYTIGLPSFVGVSTDAMNRDDTSINVRYPELELKTSSNFIDLLHFSLGGLRLRQNSYPSFRQRVRVLTRASRARHALLAALATGWATVMYERALNLAPWHPSNQDDDPESGNIMMPALSLGSSTIRIVTRQRYGNLHVKYASFEDYYKSSLGCPRP